MQREHQRINRDSIRFTELAKHLMHGTNDTSHVLSPQQLLQGSGNLVYLDALRVHVYA